jgi:hypothetical protein
MRTDDETLLVSVVTSIAAKAYRKFFPKPVETKRLAWPDAPDHPSGGASSQHEDYFHYGTEVRGRSPQRTRRYSSRVMPVLPEFAYIIRPKGWTDPFKDFIAINIVNIEMEKLQTFESRQSAEELL